MIFHVHDTIDEHASNPVRIQAGEGTTKDGAVADPIVPELRFSGWLAPVLRTEFDVMKHVLRCSSGASVLRGIVELISQRMHVRAPLYKGVL